MKYFLIPLLFGFVLFAGKSEPPLIQQPTDFKPYNIQEGEKSDFLHVLKLAENKVVADSIKQVRIFQSALREAEKVPKLEAEIKQLEEKEKEIDTLYIEKIVKEEVVCDTTKCTLKEGIRNIFN